jgi:hypothetical protein
MDDAIPPLKIRGINPIGKPCPMGELAELFLRPGKGGAATCSKCDKPVHNLYGKTPAEVEAFVRNNPNACVQLTKQGRLRSPRRD